MNRLVLFIILIISSFQLFAQTGTVRGFVYEETSGEPAMFSNIILDNISPLLINLSDILFVNSCK